MVGDLMHLPVQCAEPAWEMHTSGGSASMDDAGAQRSRRRCLEELSESGAYIFPAHWTLPRGARISSDGEAWKVDVSCAEAGSR